MKGTLKKNHTGWVIEPIYTVSGKGLNGLTIPLDLEQAKAFEFNVDWYEEVVDFETWVKGDKTYAFINNETDCTCEIGRPYHNLTCKIHGSAMFTPEDLDKKPSNITFKTDLKTATTVKSLYEPNGLQLNKQGLEARKMFETSIENVYVYWVDRGYSPSEIKEMLFSQILVTSTLVNLRKPQ